MKPLLERIDEVEPFTQLAWESDYDDVVQFLYQKRVDIRYQSPEKIIYFDGPVRVIYALDFQNSTLFKSVTIYSGRDYAGDWADIYYGLYDVFYAKYGPGIATTTDKGPAMFWVQNKHRVEIINDSIELAVHLIVEYYPKSSSYR